MDLDVKNPILNADKLLEWIGKKTGQVKIRPDEKLFIQKEVKFKR